MSAQFDSAVSAAKTAATARATSATATAAAIAATATTVGHAVHAGAHRIGLAAVATVAARSGIADHADVRAQVGVGAGRLVVKAAGAFVAIAHLALGLAAGGALLVTGEVVAWCICAWIVTRRTLARTVESLAAAALLAVAFARKFGAGCAGLVVAAAVATVAMAAALAVFQQQDAVGHGWGQQRQPCSRYRIRATSAPRVASSCSCC